MSSGNNIGTQALMGLLLLIVGRFLQAAGAPAYAVWMFGGIAILLLLGALRGMWQAYQWHRMLKMMAAPTGLYGRTEYADAASLGASGLKFSNEDGNGIPLAAAGGRIIYWHGNGHASFRAPTNMGKTESSAANICYALGAHRNIIATAKGAELAWLCAGYRRDVLKQNVVVVGPWELMKAHGLHYTDFNPVGHLVSYAERNDPELVDKARGVAEITLPEPEGASGENKFFRSLGRDLIAWALVFLAWREADTGEPSCNLSYLYTVFCGSDAELKAFLEEMRRCPIFGGAVRRAADRFLGRITRAPKLGESILSTAQEAIQIYEPSGVLGRRSVYSAFDPSDLKNPKKPTSVFFEIPPDKVLTHGKHFGLCLNALIDTCIAADRYEPRVTVIADEFANICDGPIPSALPCLYLGRSRGVQLLTYVQEVESYTRYGKESSAFTTQCEVVIAWGIRSTKDAEEYSKRSGQRSVMTESGSLPMTGADASGRPSLSLSEKGIPQFRPDEFLHMREFTAALFYRQNPPVIVDLVSYRTVDPWRSYGTPMPGSPPTAAAAAKYQA